MKFLSWLLVFLIGFVMNLYAQPSHAQARWVSPQVIEWRVQAHLVVDAQYWLLTEAVYAENSRKHALALLETVDGVARFSTQHLQTSIANLLKGYLAVAIVRHGEVIEQTLVQTGELIDDLYAYDGELGVTFHNRLPIVRVWAPTALSVKLHLFADDVTPHFTTQPMFLQPLGVWECVGNDSWMHQYYLYEVEVYVPASGKIEKNLVTDPYSVALATNSTRSQIADLRDPRWMPKNWQNFHKPSLASLSDIVIYELHVRDFSSYDDTVPVNLRGRYGAFTLENSRGVQHLRKLAQAGLTHLHLLPVFDIATIEEYHDKRQEPVIPNAPADSPQQQAIINIYKDLDGYNWGYDPFHYNTPEGSYAVNPEGMHRVLEFREMVQAINNLGLRVVLDVVYNHTHSCGQHNKSVLDKIVPNYYYRFDNNGYISSSSCCPDIASERMMAEKLIVDSLTLWAIHYKIDGFRFDLMGHLSKANMLKIREKLKKLTLEKDGVDGQKIYLYGEGWRFGSLVDKAPMEAFYQTNAYGCGIGTFNDRIRDSIRGGNFQHSSKSDQGFINGLFYDFNYAPENSETSTDLCQQKLQLLNYMDNIKIGMAGNLRDFVFVTTDGKSKRGSEICYRGNPPAGYTAAPQECINYADAHDNYTLWDQINAKAPFLTINRNPQTATAEERMRMQWLAMSIVMMGQGIPFFQAGTEMLRSKSGDGDSFNSGDWFNRLDFSYQTNNWGVGLPPAWKNHNEWSFWRARLVDTQLTASPMMIANTVDYFCALLRIRKENELLRLQTLQQVQDYLKFPKDKDSEDIAGLIVCQLQRYNKEIWIFINANRQSVSFINSSLQGKQLELHQELLKVDPIVNDARFFLEQGLIQIPGRTTLVYLSK